MLANNYYNLNIIFKNYDIKDIISESIFKIEKF